MDIKGTCKPFQGGGKPFQGGGKPRPYYTRRSLARHFVY